MVPIFLKDLRLIVRDRALLLFSVVVPIAVITIIAAALFAGSEGPRLSIAVVDEDHGAVARDLKRALAERAAVVELSRDEAVRFVRDQNRGPAAVVFPAGLSENYARGTPTELLLLTDPAQETGLRALRVLLLLMEKQAASGADPLSQRMIVLKERDLTGNRPAITGFELNLPGFSIMFVLVAIIFSTALSLHDEHDWGTASRLLVAPTHFDSLLVGKLGARVVLGIAQLLLLLLWSHIVFGVSLGTSPLALAAVVCSVVLATVATGLLVAGLTRSREQVQPLALALVILLSGLGGLWWPQFMEPDWLRAVSPAVYTTWAIRAMNDLVLRDRGLAVLAVPVSVMTAYWVTATVIGLRLVRARHGAR
jgi:ABC-2 type transport system permease protein